MEKPILSGLNLNFLLHFIVALVFGLFFLLFPQAWGNLAGMPIFSHE